MTEHSVVTSGFLPTPPVGFYIYCMCGWGLVLPGTAKLYVSEMPRTAVQAFREHVDDAEEADDPHDASTEGH